MTFRKFFVVAMFAMMFLLSENVSAMTFSQPVKIGEVIAPPTEGLEIYNAVYCDGILKKDRNGKTYHEIKYGTNGVTQFAHNEDAIYFHYEPNERIGVFFGAKNKNNRIPVEVGLYGCTIYQIKNDSGIKFYIVAPREAMAVVLNYTLLGKKSDGTFVKYLNFRDVWNKYVGNNRPNGRTFTEDVHCDGDSIVIKYTHYEKNIKKDIGEFRFKWDDAAQWFGVEHKVY